LNSSGARIGWLEAAGGDFETLKLLIDAGASKGDQSDKNLALIGAARSGSVEAVRALIAYGASPNAEFNKGDASESVLSAAAKSGNPEVLGEILRYHPKLEQRNRDGETAIFAAVEDQADEVGGRAECVRLLAQAGANLNAQDIYGDTPLHEATLTDVVEVLLKLGADVNARNKEGETPIFTTSNVDAIPLFAQYGADFTIRNQKGETALEASANRGAKMQEALRQAMQKAQPHLQP
jgi:ankyrin repeat protein